MKTLKLAEQFPLLTKGSQICDQEHEAHEEGGLVAFWQSAPGGAGDLESGIATPRQVSDDDERCTKCKWSTELFSCSRRAVVHHIVTSLVNHEDRERLPDKEQVFAALAAEGFQLVAARVPQSLLRLIGETIARREHCVAIMQVFWRWRRRASSWRRRGCLCACSKAIAICLGRTNLSLSPAGVCGAGGGGLSAGGGAGAAVAGAHPLDLDTLLAQHTPPPPGKCNSFVNQRLKSSSFSTRNPHTKSGSTVHAAGSTRRLRQASRVSSVYSLCE